jgi:ribonuclease I
MATLAQRFALTCFTVLLAAAPVRLAPVRHDDFEHYTFALTWQPGMCAAAACRPDQPKTPLIGLHGLWPSLPKSLSARGIVNPQWWMKGCDFYHHSDAPPPIDASLRRRLEAVMPQFSNDLLTHEYDKHVQCFGYDPAAFFTTELAMRRAVVVSPFGAYLMQHVGRSVEHGALVRRFQSAFGTDRKTALQLRCERTGRGELVLTQLWMTIRASEIAAFPRPVAFMETFPKQDTCPLRFRIPAWK